MSVLKKTVTITLSSGGNASLGINKDRPLYGVYANSLNGSNGIYLTPYSTPATTDWYVHAESNNAIYAGTIEVIAYYGNLVSYLVS